MSDNDIYAIAGRIKNFIAKEDIGLTENGKVLCNLYALTLKKIYDFSDTLSPNKGDELRSLLKDREKLVAEILKIITPSAAEEEWDAEDETESEQDGHYEGNF